MVNCTSVTPPLPRQCRCWNWCFREFAPKRLINFSVTAYRVMVGAGTGQEPINVIFDPTKQAVLKIQ